MPNAASSPISNDIDDWIRRFERQLIAYASRITDDVERARDVVQETFVELERRMRQDAPSISPAWLFTICRNRALNICRKDRRLVFQSDDLLNFEASSAPPPSHQLDAKETQSFLMRIVASLPPRQQEVLQLRFQSDLSYAEIARITNLSINSVGVLIHAAITTLRKRYAPAAREFLST